MLTFSPSFDRDALRQAVAALAAGNVFIGTSSWKYPGWRGQLYEEDRYVNNRFEGNALHTILAMIGKARTSQLV